GRTASGSSWWRCSSASQAPYTMCSAVDFFPSTISTLQNLATSRSRNFGSGVIFRLGTSRRRGMGSALRLLDAVLGPALRPVRLVGVGGTAGARRVERTAHDVVAHARQVLHAAATDEDDRVLLKVVPLARDVGGDLDPVRQPDAGHLAEGRVRLLGSGRVHAGADPPLL